MDEFTLKVIERLAKERGLDPLLVRAIIAVESCGRNTVRFEPNYKYLERPEVFAKANNITLATEVCLQRLSWGLMQVMGGTARWLGYHGHLLDLGISIPSGIEYGIRYLKTCYQKYATNTKGWSEAAIAAYNEGSPKKRADGLWLNEEYVRDVERNYMALLKL